ncbi:MAG: hypothetical protein NVS3B5_13200 [Sphingomicrobium sp.]
MGVTHVVMGVDMADSAACRGASDTVMMRKVSGNGAYRSTLEAATSNCWRR